MNDSAGARVEVQRVPDGPDGPDGPIMHRVRRAGPAHAQHVAELLSVAFMDDPVTSWLFPDPDDRARRHPDFFRIFTDRALASGAVYLTADGHAAALWLHIGHGAPPPPIPGEPLAAACGPNLPRMQILDELVEAGHPQHRHDYLSFMGVRPDQQGRGLGAALLRHRVADLDAAGVPAYLEATSPRNCRLYERMGFTPLPATMNLPDGPCLFPMWRPADTGRSAGQPAADRAADVAGTDRAERARQRDLVRRGYDAISVAYRGDDARPAASSAEDISRYAGWVAELAGLLPPRARVVDLGCGAGIPATRDLTGLGLQVIGVDFSAVQLHRAQRLAPAASLVLADMAALALRPASVDAVVSFYALIHLPLPDQRELFSRVRSWLRTGGYFLAILGAQAWTGTEDYLGARMFWDHTDTDTYLRLLRAAGLTPLWHRFVPEGDAGHSLILCRAG